MKKTKKKQIGIGAISNPKYPKILADANIRKILAAIACIITIALVAVFVSLNVNGLLKFIAAILVLGIDGQILRYLLALEGDMGLIILRWKEGTEKIKRISETLGKYWNDFADIGLVLSFGLSSKLAFKHIKTKTYIVGMLFFLIFVFVILPNSGSITLSLIQIPLETVQAASKMIWISIAALAIVLLFGVVGFAMFGIIANAGMILFSIIAFLMGNSAALATSSPGVYPVLPYFTIPLFEGLIALLVLMVVHEGSHGIASIVAKIRLKSTGIITFGFIPVGAFVDIDEKQLDNKRDIDNARVSVAGSTANLFVALIFFIPTALLMMPAAYSPLSLQNFQQPILSVTGVVKNLDFTGENITIGTKIYSVNGIAVSNTTQYLNVIENLSANSTITLMTNKGESKTKMVMDGIPGFVVGQPFKKEFGFIMPIFATLGLITILNLLVGIVNLLPIPSFDGHRLFKIIFKEKWIVNVITGIILLSFLMNIVPWIWQ